MAQNNLLRNKSLSAELDVATVVLSVVANASALLRLLPYTVTVGD